MIGSYPKEVLDGLPTLKQRGLELLLPHNWRPPVATSMVPTAVAAT